MDRGSRQEWVGHHGRYDFTEVLKGEVGPQVPD